MTRRSDHFVLRVDPILCDGFGHCHELAPELVQVDEWGQPWASPRPTNTSGDFLSLIGTDGFVELPPGPMTYPKGFVATLYRW